MSTKIPGMVHLGHILRHSLLDLDAPQLAILLLTLLLSIFESFAQYKHTLFYWRTTVGFQPISPATASFGVYLPTPKKNLMALLCTATIQEYDRNPQIGAL